MSEHIPSHGVPEWTLGDRLGKALAFSGVTNSEMADYLEVSRNTVGNYIAGRTRVPGATLRLWAMKTGVPLEWLRDGTRPGHTPPPGEELPASGEPGNGGDKLSRLTEAKRRRVRHSSDTLGISAVAA